MPCQSLAPDGVTLPRLLPISPTAPRRLYLLADDPSKVPPPPPRKTTLETIYMIASKNWVATSFFLLICVFVVLLRCLFPKAVEQHLEEDAAFDDDDTSSPSFGSRTFGNVPLSQQQTRSVAAAATSGKAGVPKARTFDNVPLSQQKPHAD